MGPGEWLDHKHDLLVAGTRYRVHRRHEPDEDGVQFSLCGPLNSRYSLVPQKGVLRPRNLRTGNWSTALGKARFELEIGRVVQV